MDDDHIGGLLSAFDNDGLLSQLTDKVWFNSGKLIFKHFNKTPDASNLVYLKGNDTAVGEARIPLAFHMGERSLFKYHCTRDIGFFDSMS